MKLLIQRVKQARVKVDNRVVGSIDQGFVVFLGVGQGDTKEEVKRYVDKMLKLRIFKDERGLTNLSLDDVGGKILLVSQFTLYADCKKGNRPSFTDSAEADLARDLYEYSLELIEKELGSVESGLFGADMDVELVNDGPFTIVLDLD